MIEYKLLVAEDLNKLDPQGVQWPLDTFGVVAFEDGKVVGRLALRNMPVLEAWYVDPERRGGEIADELALRAEDLLRSQGRTHAACLSYDEAPAIRRYIHSLGYEDFPVKLHIKELTKEVKAA